MCDVTLADCGPQPMPLGHAPTAVREQCEKSRREAASSPAAGGRSSSLDHLETSQHPLSPQDDDGYHPMIMQSRCQYAFHGPNWDQRKAVIDALWESEDPAHQKRARRMAWCGFSARVYVGSDGGAGVYPDRCRDRLCPTCGAYRAHGLRERAERVLARADSVRFVTLTLRHSDAPLGATIRRLRDAWNKLRRGKWWRRHVTGGLYGIEVKQNPTTRHWHVHLHCLVEGEYLDQRTLSSSWECATGDSPIVDVRAVHSRKQAVRYIASYVTKGSAVAGWEPTAIQEFADAMRGQRLLQTFGSLHGIPVDVNEPEEEPEAPVCVLNLIGVVWAAEKGVPHTCVLVAALAQMNDRLSDLLDELLPTFDWGRWEADREPLDIVREWRICGPLQNRDGPPIAVQLELWT